MRAAERFGPASRHLFPTSPDLALLPFEAHQEQSPHMTNIAADLPSDGGAVAHIRSAPSLIDKLFPNGGELGRLIREHDWSSTPLGSIEVWPQSLRTAVSMVLYSDFPMIVLWGPELVQIYNDGYRILMGAKHPRGLGQGNRECWPEAWHINKDIYPRIFAGET